MTAPIIRRALPLLPACATTGIGSLPHTQLELALQLSLQLDLPFLPQLPTGNPSELMIASALDGLPGLRFDAEGMCTVELAEWERDQVAFDARLQRALSTGELSEFEPSAQACRAWRPFLWEVEHRKLAFAKVQVAGPFTVRWLTRLAGEASGRAVADHPQLDEQIFRLVMAKALAMVKALRRAGVTPLLYLDEPGLYAFQRTEARHVIMLQELRLLAVAAQREGALVGVHCCSNTDWSQLMELGLDLLSTDVRLSLDALLVDRKGFARFLETGATLSLGIVPTDLKSSYVIAELVESVEASLRASLPRGRPFEAFGSRVVLTPACGLALRSVLDAEHIFEDLRAAQKQLKQAVQPLPATA